jgi:signal transduction histidine kinase
MLQGERELMNVAKLILSELAPVVSAQHGVFYMMDKTGGTPLLRLTSTYAFRERKGLVTQFKVGEGLVGQCALEKERILVTDVPGDYVRISSGLGNTPPLSIVVLPVLFEGEVKAVIELASVNRFKDIHLTLLDQLTETIAIVLNTIAANMRTESLLTQSQSLADELTGQQEQLQEKNTRLEEQATSLRASEDLLKKQQDELRRANDELERKARQLSDQKAAVEGKNREIELAKLAVQERAEQLALTSKYKSEFLANMSHELRTPLNSLLILSEMLEENADRNLTPKQLEFAQTIHSSGSDLLSLINDILDMAKIESGTMSVEVGEVAFEELDNYVERTFRPVAENKGLEFRTALVGGLPKYLLTDVKRLQQILRNLLSNAFKFTDDGSVSFEVEGHRGLEPGASNAGTRQYGGGLPHSRYRYRDSGG